MIRTHRDARRAGVFKLNPLLIALLAASLVGGALWTQAALAQREPSRREPARQEPARRDRVEEFSLPVEKQRELRVADAPKPAMRDLVDVFSRLSASQRRDLGPLTEAERRELRRQDGAFPLREKVGVVRALTPELRLAGLNRSALRNRSAETAGGGRVELSGDQLVWTTEISSTGATSLRVQLSNADLPAGAKVYVTDGKRQVYGPYRPGPEPLWTNTVFGSAVYVQVQVPAAEAEREATALSITGVVHEERPVEDSSARRGGGGLLAPQSESLAAVSCDLEAFCRPTTTTPNPSPEEALFETASLGVAHISFVEGGGSFICSGGLLADRQGTNTPFFLTAHHCFETQASATSLETFWRYRRVCGQSAPDLSTLPRTLGSTLLATSSQTDFTLVQLSQRPPEGSHFFRWTIDDLSSSTTTIYRLHHPKGYSQHLQVSTIQPVNTCSGELPNGRFLYSSPQRGGTLGGSSGSLVFRANGTTPEVVGQLYGACFEDPPACGYWNVDGAFAQTYPSVRRFLDNAAPGQGPTVEFLRPQDNAEAPANSPVEIVARIRDTDGIASAQLYWEKTNRFLPCPGTNNLDWRCEVSGEEYRWVIDVGSAGPRRYHAQATDRLGDQTITPTRTVNIR
jgi:hypothetical protein